ncbi:site-specific integrase [Priestia megaterium]|uniref:site-specific integrase n=1 Tax=Priestia megaterium TaxID=1404 RepID=UPI000EF986AC|nr:site-specific integrase [Priestia megaterium]RMA90237.1 site-specific recombinase XerD [Priestia megaterium]
MQGSIKKDKTTGKYYFIVDIGRDELTGKRRQKKKRGFTTKKEAEKALAVVLNELNLGTFIEPQLIDLDSFIKEWFVERQTQLAKSTLKNHKCLYRNHLKPKLGHYKLQDLNPIVLQKFTNSLVADSSLSHNSIRKLLFLMNQLMKKAHGLKLISENPLIHVNIPREVKSEMSIWDLRQVNYYIANAKQNRYYTIVLMALLTGMRKGEILGLRWRDIDFEKQVVYIRQIYDGYAKELKVGAKTASGVRSIHIPDMLVNQLKKERKKVLSNKLKQGMAYNDYDLVNCTKFGNPLDSSTLSKRFKNHTKKLGLPVIRFHDLRHTHVTMLIQQNVNVKVISERVGHSSIQITLNQYSHVLPSMQQEVADKLNTLFVNM